MRTRLSITALILLFAAVARGQVFYDLNFNSPTHTVGAPVTVGSSPDVVSAIVFGTPSPVATYDHLNDQPLKMDLVGNSPLYYYDQFRLHLPAPHVPQLWVDFDFDSVGLIGSLSNFTVFFDAPSVQNVIFHHDGSISLFGSTSSDFIYDTPIGNFEDHTAYRFSIAIDQVQGVWSVFQNGSLMGSQAWLPTAGISNLRFSFGTEGEVDGSSAAIDNLTVSSFPIVRPVPEPSTYGIVGAILLLGLAARQRNLAANRVT